MKNLFSNKNKGRFSQEVLDTQRKIERENFSISNTVYWILTAMALILDSLVIYQSFVGVVSNVIVLISITAVSAAALDLIPCAMGMLVARIKKDEGKRGLNIFFLILGSMIFLIIFTLLFKFRWDNRAALAGGGNAFQTNASQSSSFTVETEADIRAKTFAIIIGICPLITSVALFIASYLREDRRIWRLKSLKVKAINIIDDNQDKLQACDQILGMEEYLEDYLNGMYDNTLQVLENIEKRLKITSRDELVKNLDGLTATTELIQECMELVDKNKATVGDSTAKALTVDNYEVPLHSQNHNTIINKNEEEDDFADGDIAA